MKTSCTAQAFAVLDGVPRYIGQRKFKRYTADPHSGYVQYNRRIWRARYDANTASVTILEEHKHYFGFRYVTHSHSKHKGRIDGQLYWFRTLKDRNDWLQGHDLPDSMDSFQHPVHFTLGEYRKKAQAHQLPAGWRASDAVRWSAEQYI